MKRGVFPRTPFPEKLKILIYKSLNSVCFTIHTEFCFLTLLSAPAVSFQEYVAFPGRRTLRWASYASAIRSKLLKPKVDYLPSARTRAQAPIRNRCFLGNRLLCLYNCLKSRLCLCGTKAYKVLTPCVILNMRRFVLLSVFCASQRSAQLGCVTRF